jgi:hypothetical protein
LFNKFFVAFLLPFSSTKIGKQARKEHQGYYAICRAQLLLLGNVLSAGLLRSFTLAQLPVFVT